MDRARRAQCDLQRITGRHQPGRCVVVLSVLSLHRLRPRNHPVGHRPGVLLRGYRELCCRLSARRADAARGWSEGGTAVTHPERGQKVRATWTTVVEGILDGVDNNDNLRIICSDKSHRWAPPNAEVEILLHDEPALG